MAAPYVDSRSANKKQDMEMIECYGQVRQLSFRTKDGSPVPPYISDFPEFLIETHIAMLPAIRLKLLIYLSVSTVIPPLKAMILPLIGNYFMKKDGRRKILIADSMSLRPHEISYRYKNIVISLCESVK